MPAESAPLPPAPTRYPLPPGFDPTIHMPAPFTARVAAPDELTIAAYQRHAMFEEMGSGTPEALGWIPATFIPWAREQMAAGQFWTWLIVAPADDPAIEAIGHDEARQARVACGGGLWLRPTSPHLKVPLEVARPHIMNVYTEPSFRRRGLAAALVRLMAAWSHANGYLAITLGASDAGRPIYEAIGFRPTTEMSLKLES